MRDHRHFISLRQLRAFDAVARHESVSAAAKELHVSQPAVTQAIANLERQLSVALLERRRTGSYVTGLGAVLLPRVRRLLAHIQEALCDPLVGASFADRETVGSLEIKITGTHIRSLIAVADGGSFERAARRLEISQPSLHRSARDLERVLRRTLYRRTARGVSPTLQAIELARRLKVALREIQYGIDEIQAAQGIFTSRITIGNIAHSDAHLLSAALNKLLALYPNAIVQVLGGRYEALLEDLRGGDLDFLFGVLRRPDWATDVDEELLFSNPYAVVVRREHPLAQRRKVTPRDLAAYDWILPARGAPRREAFEGIFAGSDFAPKVSIETTSAAIYRTILATSDRITLLSRLEAQFDNNAGRLTTLPFDSAALSRQEGVATRVGWEPTRIHREFLELLRRQAQDFQRSRPAA
ncbi:MAG TPA: LysR family transcriptional regulator [Xanthobacteraceae bacterium]